MIDVSEPNNCNALLQGHLNLSVLYSAVAAFVSHALKIYSGTNNERNTIERQMSKVMPTGRGSGFSKYLE